MQMHLEFLVDDLEATGARVLAAGATRFEHQPNAHRGVVYADPAGHRSACQRGGSRESATDTVSAWTAPR